MPLPWTILMWVLDSLQRDNHLLNPNSTKCFNIKQENSKLTTRKCYTCGRPIPHATTWLRANDHPRRLAHFLSLKKYEIACRWESQFGVEPIHEGLSAMRTPLTYALWTLTVTELTAFLTTKVFLHPKKTVLTGVRFDSNRGSARGFRRRQPWRIRQPRWQPTRRIPSHSRKLWKRTLSSSVDENTAFYIHCLYIQ